MENSFQEQTSSSQHPSGVGPGANQHTQEHEKGVYAVSWSKANRIVSASQDGVIQVWDAFTGSQLVTYREHQSHVNSVAWSSNNKYIASAHEDGTVRVHQVAWNTEIGGFQKRGKPARSVAWSPDGNCLASGGADTLVHLWKLKKVNNDEFVGLEVGKYQNHKMGKGMSGASINTIVWSPQDWCPPNWASANARFIASAGDDKTVHIWEASKREEVLRYEEHKFRINALAWSPDGKFIASGGDCGSLRIWKLLAGKDKVESITVDKSDNPRNTIYTTIMGKNQELHLNGKKLTLYDITALAWSPDGKSLAAASWKSVYIFQHNQGRITREYHYTDHNDWVRALAWSPDSQYIASGGDGKCVRVWSAIDYREDPI